MSRSARVTIENGTAWATADLRAMVVACMRFRGAREAKRVRIFERRTGEYVCGYAYLGRVDRLQHGAGHRRHEAGWFEVGIPRAWGAPLTPEQLGELARVVDHELLHTLGVEHADMTPRQHGRLHEPGPPPEWAAGLVLRTQAELAPPPPARLTPAERGAKLRALRAAHARDMLAAHERKLAREKKLVAKWRAKVRRYEKGIT